MMKKTKKLLIVVFSLLFIVGGLLTYAYLNQTKKDEVIDQTPIINETIEEPTTPFTKEEIISLKENYKTNKATNSDYQGEIIFKSNLINISFVQASDNDKYLRRDWLSGNYSEMGSIFMDCDCNLSSQNIVIYGHYVYESFNTGLDVPNSTLMFTPLAQFVKQENYETNKTLYLILANEIREYEVAVAYYCPILDHDTDDARVEGSLYYYLPEYDETTFQAYYENMLNKQFYDTGLKLTNNDKLLTLQTCVEFHPELREIIVCKQTNVYSITQY